MPDGTPEASTAHLTHGWESGLPAADSVLRQYVLANVACNAHAARSSGGRVARWDDVAAADPASAVFFDNMANLLLPPTLCDLDDVVTRLLDFYPPERHFVLLSPWPTADLTGHGLALMGHPPLMVRPAGGEAPPLPDGLTIERVTDAATLATFVEVLVAAFGFSPGTGSVLAAPAFLDGPVQLFLARIDGEAVGTAGARTAEGVVDVDWVATLPAHRGRGYGAALTWAAALAEPDWPAVLIASDDGQPVYASMGFLRLLRLTLWHRPPPDQGPA